MIFVSNLSLRAINVLECELYATLGHLLHLMVIGLFLK